MDNNFAIAFISFRPIAFIYFFIFKNCYLFYYCWFIL